MILNLIAIGLVLGLGWVWATRGFFSAAIHLVCVLIAGAVAFGLWEVVAAAILGLAPETGFLSVLEGSAWGGSLMLTFAITLAVLRGVSDSLLRGNIKVNDAVNLAGGGVCGLASATITVGIIVIAFGYFRLPTGALMYKPVDFAESSEGGSIVRGGGLWLPADTITAGLYGQLSKTSLSTGTPLAEWYPDLTTSGYAATLSFSDGNARAALSNDDFRLGSAYVVGNPTTGSSISDLLRYRDGDNTLSQRYVDLDGDPVPNGFLFGQTVVFGATAKEEGGQVIMGHGQIRLLARNTAGETITIHPVAMVSQGEPDGGGDDEVFGRFRFDGEAFVASVGGAAEAPMAFEFVVPQGYQPEALYVRGARQLLPADALTSAAQFGGADLRDQRIADGSLLSGSKLNFASLARAENVATAAPTLQLTGTGAVRNSILAVVNDQIGSRVPKRLASGFTIDEQNLTVRGRITLAFSEFNNQSTRGQEASLFTSRYKTPDGTRMVQLDVSGRLSDGSSAPGSTRHPAILNSPSDEPPRLIDSDGNVYAAIGWIYTDREVADIRYILDSPLRGLNQIPDEYTISATRRDQQLRLLFTVTDGKRIEGMVIGETVVLDFNPPLAIQ